MTLINEDNYLCKNTGSTRYPKHGSNLYLIKPNSQGKNGHVVINIVAFPKAKIGRWVRFKIEYEPTNEEMIEESKKNIENIPKVMKLWKQA
jgi:hypothetical protein